MIAIDHLAVATTDLGLGAGVLEARLGVPLEPGGKHEVMGTHNRLLSLGPAEYLELIAPDPAARPPFRPRWFGLDEFAGPPALRAWVLRVPDLTAALALAPPGAGTAVEAQRGALRWRIGVPADGNLPFDGLFPAMIEWISVNHPAPRLPERGIRLAALELHHPQAEALARAVAALTDDPRLRVRQAAHPALRAALDTPRGRVWL
jgi:hypothetical protein